MSNNLYVGAPGFSRFMPYDVIKKAHVLYRAGMSMRELSEQLYERFGYTSAVSCECALNRAFRAHGFRIRSQHEARRAFNRGLTCAGCGCSLDERTTGCAPCTNRHNDRRKRGGLPVVDAPPREACSGCGVPYAERTRGCGPCTQRHALYRLRGVAHVVSTFRDACDGCGCELNSRTRGCNTCASRFYRRRVRAASRASAAPPPAPRTAESPGGGTTLERSAA